jgi:hypothetical protein
MADSPHSYTIKLKLTHEQIDRMDVFLACLTRLVENFENRDQVIDYIMAHPDKFLELVHTARCYLHPSAPAVDLAHEVGILLDTVSYVQSALATTYHSVSTLYNNSPL